MELKVNHETRYEYSEPVQYALQKVRLRPLSSVMQDVLDWSVDVTGGKIETSYCDHYGNHVDLISIERGADQLIVRVSGTVETKVSSGVLGKVYGRAPLWHFQQPTLRTTPGPKIRALPQIDPLNENVVADLHALSAAILEQVPYTIGGTHSQTTAEEAMSGALGVCQDHAQIFVAVARLSGLPARYVSGYLKMNEIVDQDATHAWAEVHLDSLGWVGFDVSNGVSPDEKYVRIAMGRDARDASPIEGLRMGTAEETLVVSVQVQQ